MNIEILEELVICLNNKKIKYHKKLQKLNRAITETNQLINKICRIIATKKLQKKVE